ncbi:MAG: hypothetical protein EOP84_24090 [Verrucomicrobiaceae bacterium]|nr:MAG: hypothetical protein EOP84_24090 [Verrucomicrobiaceae bacterium]
MFDPNQDGASPIWTVFQGLGALAGIIALGCQIPYVNAKVTLDIRTDEKRSAFVYIANIGRKPFTILQVFALSSCGNVIATLFDAKDEEAPFLTFGQMKSYKLPDKAHFITHKVRVILGSGKVIEIEGNPKADMYSTWAAWVYEAADSIVNSAIQQSPYDSVMVTYSVGSGDFRGLVFDPFRPKDRECGRLYLSPNHRMEEKVDTFLSTYSFMFEAVALDQPGIAYEVVWTDKAMALMRNMEPANLRWFRKEMERTRKGR